MLLQSQVKQRLQQYDPRQSHYQTYQSKPWKSRLRLVFTSTLPKGAISLSLSLSFSLNIYNIYIYPIMSSTDTDSSIFLPLFGITRNPWLPNGIFDYQMLPSIVKAYPSTHFLQQSFLSHGHPFFQMLLITPWNYCFPRWSSVTSWTFSVLVNQFPQCLDQHHYSSWF